MKRRDFIKTLGAAGLAIPLAASSHVRMGDMEMERSGTEADPGKFLKADGTWVDPPGIDKAVFDLQKVDEYNISGDNGYRLLQSLDGQVSRQAGMQERNLTIYMTLPDQEEFEKFIASCVRPEYRFTVVDGDIKLGEYTATSYEKFMQVEMKDVLDFQHPPPGEYFLAQTYFTASINMRRIYS